MLCMLVVDQYAVSLYTLGNMSNYRRIAVRLAAIEYLKVIACFADGYVPTQTSLVLLRHVRNQSININITSPLLNNVYSILV